ncbi:MAG: GNAT family N-acetyltransferase [Actinomycetota bacterium]
MLEPLTAEHAADLFPHLRDPELYRHLDEDPPPDPEWLARRFAALAAGAPAGRDEVWLNWAIRAEGALVGTTQATVRSDGPTSIAYVIGRAVWGRGVARAATAEMLECLALDHGVVEVQAEIDPANERSIRLVDALGFRDAGIVGSDRRFVRRLDR